MEEKVIHEKENERFVLYVDGKEAYVEYNAGESELNLYHTHTDPELRGKGLAAQVVRAALEYIEENKLKVVPTCSYVRAFIKKNDEYEELVAD